MKTLTQRSIEQLDIADLTPHPDNPRVHSKAQIKQIAKSIEMFGFVIFKRIWLTHPPNVPRAVEKAEFP